MPLRIPAPKTLSDLIINVDKDWAGKNITNLGSGAFDLNAKFSDIPASAWATVFSTTFPIATVLNDHTKAAHDALGIAPAAHAPTHKDGGADELDVSELAGALGSAGEIPESDGDAVSWVDPDGRYDPKAHVLATTGPHTGTLPLIDLEVGVQGNIIHRGAADWAALAVGVAGEALLSSGAAADVSWGAPVPAAHESTHVRAGSDDIDAPLDARALAMISQGDMVYLTSVANVIARLAPGTAGQALLTGGPAADPSWGAPAPAAHATTHQSGGSDEIRNMEWLTSLANLGYSGDTSLVTVGENVVGGDTLFLQNDGKYWKSDADAAATMPVKVMAVETILADATGLVLHDGYYRNDTLYDWTPGAGAANLLFADVNPGALVQLAGQPAGAGDQIQVCGWIVNENQICFRPSLELIEHS